MSIGGDSTPIFGPQSDFESQAPAVIDLDMQPEAAIDASGLGEAERLQLELNMLHGVLNRERTARLEAEADLSNERELRRTLEAQVASERAGRLAAESQVEQLGQTLQHRDAALEVANRNSQVDALTGLGNRMAFDIFCQNEVTTAREINPDGDRTYDTEEVDESQQDFVLFIDLDKFKLVNDNRGHEAGDNVLKEVAEILVRSIRHGDDRAFRYGGEEFAVILRRLSSTKAREVAEKIRVAIDEETAQPESTHHITASIGLCSFEHGLQQSINLADGAMYLAKEQGRNRVKAYPEDINGQQSSLTWNPLTIASRALEKILPGWNAGDPAASDSV